LFGEEVKTKDRAWVYQEKRTTELHSLGLHTRQVNWRHPLCSENQMNPADLKECAGLKEKYDTCYSEWKKTKVSEMQLGSHICTTVFEDYRDCVIEGMKARLASEKSTKEGR